MGASFAYQRQALSVNSSLVVAQWLTYRLLRLRALQRRAVLLALPIQLFR
ncbi:MULTISPECIES: hypothetical protein [Deinococcus]|nr:MULTISPECIES: hypothetical protein [Deinococcus]MCY1704159.1 hypothetical protein [Deinococcus sp. SL84]